MALVVPFDQLEASSLEVVGGKALNLGILAAAGFPVPPGFVVTTQAYELAVSDRAVALLAELLAAADPAPLARRLREAILGTPVPEEVRLAVTESYRQLGPDLPVAARSSATAEALPFASFAGQQETSLNVIGGDAVERGFLLAGEARERQVL